MPTYRVKRPFTDAEGTHAVDSLIERPDDTDDQRYDLTKMVEYGMLEAAPEAAATLTIEQALAKSKQVARPRRSKPSK